MGLGWSNNAALIQQMSNFYTDGRHFITRKVRFWLKKIKRPVKFKNLVTIHIVLRQLAFKYARRL